MQSSNAPTDQPKDPDATAPVNSPEASPSAINRPGSSPKSWLPKLIIAIAVIFVVLLIAYGLNRPKSKTTTSTTNQITQIEKAAVSITKTGFSPTTIQV